MPFMYRHILYYQNNLQYSERSEDKCMYVCVLIKYNKGFVIKVVSFQWGVLHIVKLIFEIPKFFWFQSFIMH